VDLLNFFASDLVIALKQWGLGLKQLKKHSNSGSMLTYEYMSREFSLIPYSREKIILLIDLSYFRR
jgi:hypothetical protein